MMPLCRQKLSSDFMLRSLGPLAQFLGRSGLWHWRNACWFINRPSGFTDDIEVRPFGLEHEKFPNINCWLKNNAGDVEIVDNHHQIRVAVFFRISCKRFHYSIWPDYRRLRRWHWILNVGHATKCKPAVSMQRQ